MSEATERPKRTFDAGELANTTIVMANAKTEALFRETSYVGFNYSMDKDLFDKLFSEWWNGKWNDPQRRVIWVLVQRGDEQEQADPLSWLGTYLRPTVYKDTADKLHEETTYVIGPVITLKPKSGRGYATRLIQLLHYCLSHPAHLPAFPSGWGSPPGLFAGSVPRPESLPYAIGAVLTTGVGIKIYGGATIGEVPHTGFRFDRDTVNTGFTFPIDPAQQKQIANTNDPQAASWKSAWVSRKELDGLGHLVAREIRERLVTDNDIKGRAAFAPLPTLPGDLEYQLVFMNFFGAPATYNDDSLVGVRFYPADVAGDGVPAHQPEWPICIFRIGHGDKSSLVVLHISRFPVELVPDLIAKWHEAAKETGCVAVTGWSVNEEHAEIKALQERGMTVVNRYDTGAGPNGSVWYGPSDGSKLQVTDWRWRMLERWSWG